jgi:hypothetical protein
MFTDDFVRAISLDTFRARIPRQDYPVRINLEDRVIDDGIDEPPKARIAFCEVKRACSRSVMSRVILAKPMSSPASSRTASITAKAQKRLPSLRMRQPSDSKRPTVPAVRNAVAGNPRSRSSALKNVA